MYAANNYDEDLRMWLIRYEDVILPCTFIKARVIKKKFETAHRLDLVQQFVESLEDAHGNKERIKDLMH